jgi:hypothetical protein
MKKLIKAPGKIVNETIILILYVLLVIFYIGNVDEKFIGDGKGYYDYLPSIFIHHDLVRKDVPLSGPGISVFFSHLSDKQTKRSSNRWLWLSLSADYLCCSTFLPAALPDLTEESVEDLPGETRNHKLLPATYGTGHTGHHLCQ